MNGMDESITAIFDGYAAAVYEKDVEALMKLYAPEARVFDLWDHWSYEGAAAWRTMIEAWFASQGTERAKVSFADVQQVSVQGLAVVSAIVTYEGISADGEPRRAMQNRLTWALKPEGSGWKIVHEHTSAPASGEDMKVILQREPT